MRSPGVAIRRRRTQARPPALHRAWCGRALRRQEDRDRRPASLQCGMDVAPSRSAHAAAKPEVGPECSRCARPKGGFRGGGGPHPIAGGPTLLRIVSPAIWSCYLYLKNVIKIALCTLLGHGQPSPALRRAPQSPWPHAHPPTARHSLRWFASAWVSFRAHGWKIQGPGTSSRVSRKGPAAGHRQALRQLPRDARAGLGRELLVM